jgi:hypothetical protein
MFILFVRIKSPFVGNWQGREALSLRNIRPSDTFASITQCVNHMVLFVLQQRQHPSS